MAMVTVVLPAAAAMAATSVRVIQDSSVPQACVGAKRTWHFPISVQTTPGSENKCRRLWRLKSRLYRQTNTSTHAQIDAQSIFHGSDK